MMSSAEHRSVVAAVAAGLGSGLAFGGGFGGGWSGCLGPHSVGGGGWSGCLGCLAAFGGGWSVVGGLAAFGIGRIGPFHSLFCDSLHADSRICNFPVDVRCACLGGVLPWYKKLVFCRFLNLYGLSWGQGDFRNDPEP